MLWRPISILKFWSLFKLLTLFKLAPLLGVLGLPFLLNLAIHAIGCVSVIGMHNYRRSAKSKFVYQCISIKIEKMCTAPLVINRKLFGGSVVRHTLVPCGRCHECLSQKQSEFSALSVLEGANAKSLHFLTLTYDNNFVPIARKPFDSPFFFVDDSKVRDIVRELFSRDNLPMGNYPYKFSSFYITLSLRRKDVQLMLKRFRENCRKKNIDISGWKYACFGEYGEKTARPHYHMLCYNLTSQLVAELVKEWPYGFVDVKQIPLFNEDGSNARVAVSKYVSKYVGKDKFTHWFVNKGLVEKPRRISSIHFGTDALDLEELRRFISERI